MMLKGPRTSESQALLFAESIDAADAIPKVRPGDESHPRRRATKLLDKARYRARRDGIECSLTREWVLRELNRGTCAVTGIRFELRGGHGSNVMNKHAPTIDRIDPTKGYTPDNCQLVIYQYNMAKGGWSAEDVLELVRALSAHGPFD